MRKLEAYARTQRDIKAAAKASGDNELARQCDLRINACMKKYKEISDVTGIPMDLKRMSITPAKAAKNTIKELKNSGESGTINKENISNVVNGENVVGNFHPREGYDYLIDDIINYQGFNGAPTIVYDKEKFMDLVNDDHFLGERTIRSLDAESIKEYSDQLLCQNGEHYFYVNCSEGGAQYGQGMYCAADYTKGIAPISNFKHEIDQYSDGKVNYKTFWLTLDKSANILTLPYDDKATEYISDIYIDSCVKKFGVSRSEATKHLLYKGGRKMKDPGVLAAEMGYDAINAEGHGTTGSYTVILNRTKIIFYGGDLL